MKKVFYAILLFTGCFCSRGYCQDNNTVLQNIVSKLKTLSTDRIIEKAYLHFDKPYYATGDTMYFKAYLTLGEAHELSKSSGILYVDLINTQNTISNSIKLQLTNGIGWGDFALPDSLQKGNYRVRAYTRYMQNDTNYIFNQIIPVGSIIDKAPETNKTMAKADIQFFPEGGDLVDGIVSKVAFKAIGTNGLGVNAKGVIVDNANNEISKFSSAHLGMGTFYFEPEEGKSYKAKITYADGTQNTVDLPKALQSGIVLAVSDTMGKMTVRVMCNKAYLAANLNKDVNIVLYSGGLVSSANTKLDNRIIGMQVPNTAFASGVVQVTLFSQTGEPLSERLLFLQNPDLLNLAVTSDKAAYKIRERATLNVNAKTGKGLGADGHFSVSVIDESKVPVNENNETTILSYLLLTSGVRGYVEQPNYYFVNNTNIAHADLDALMLTQGYRRFNWKQLLGSSDTKLAYQPEKTMSITGLAKNSAGTPLSKKDIILTAYSGKNTLGQTTDKTDADGNFKFNDLTFQNGTSFVLRATGSTKSNSATVISISDNSQKPLTVTNYTGSADDNSHQMTIYLNSIQDQRNRLSKSINTSSNSGGSKNADQVLTGDQIKYSASFLAALNGHLNDVDFIKGLPYLKEKSGKEPMLIVVDGKIIGSYVNLDNISPANVEKVEVLKGANADKYGVYGSAGVLVITSLPGNSNADAAQDNSYRYSADKVVKLKNVPVMANTKNGYRSSNVAGAGNADQVIKADELAGFGKLSDALAGKLHGGYVNGGVPYLASSRTMGAGAAANEPMLVIVDGVSSDSNIDNFSPGSIETIEVLKNQNASIYGVRGAAGVLVITTKQNMLVAENKTSALGALKFEPAGFYKAREFYTPKYENNSTANQPDLRTTIFWKPELVTDKNGSTSFEYYNADTPGTYRVVIEGVDNAGNIGRQVYRYKVE